MSLLKNIRLQCLTMDHERFSHVEQVRYYCEQGARWIQFRTKKMNDSEALQEALQIREICTQFQTTFIVNDRPKIVVESGADGIHIGKQDLHPQIVRNLLGPKKIIGGTFNHLDDVQENRVTPLDYAGVGPWRFTETKENLAAVLTPENIKEIIKKLDIPAVVIGSVKAEDVEPIFKTGAKGVAVTAAVHPALSAENSISEFYQNLEKLV